MRELIAAARAAQRNAYAPYSKFKVGAALMAGDGAVITGCNVENASYGLSSCAERNAVFKAVSEGRRRFHAVAIAADTLEPAAPCGACRQVLSEFNPGLTVIMVSKRGAMKIVSLDQLLPYAFAAQSLRADNQKRKT
ncbi:MAG: cytidine deaminase [Candidatus Edwardsbacteria bacterium]|nr:cytidine deaminase [Candidatus Edwardsbacteria bacterium]